MQFRRLFAIALVASFAASGATKKPAPVQAPAPQKLDADYTAKIREYTTEPFFLTELVDHLPASDSVPTPAKILGTRLAPRINSPTRRTSIATCASWKKPPRE